MALAYDVEQTAAVGCVASGALWCLARDDFKTRVTAARRARIARAVRFLEGVGVPAAVSDEQMCALSDALAEV